MREISSMGNFKLDKAMRSIAIIAGEVSGDMHAAAVASALNEDGRFKLFGMGGSHMRTAGVDTVVDSESSAGGAMGFLNVVAKLPVIFAALKTLEAALRERRPEAILLVDYPGFNLKVAKIAHNLGIPVYYFIIPKMWAWKAGRIEAFKRYVTHSFTIFPFEGEWLEKRGFSQNSYVGHPIADQLQERPFDRTQVRSDLGVGPADKILAFLPGSRGHELNRHIPVMSEVVRHLRAAHPNLSAIAPVATTQHAHPMWKLAENAGIMRTEMNSLDVMRAADVGVIKSGTSILEAAACGLPSIMIYKSSALTAFIVRKFIRASDYSLPNIIRPGTLLELTQEQASKPRLVAEIENLLDPKQAECARAKYRELLTLLNPCSEENDDLTPYQRVAVQIQRAIG